MSVQLTGRVSDGEGGRGNVEAHELGALPRKRVLQGHSDGHPACEACKDRRVERQGRGRARVELRVGEGETQSVCAPTRPSARTKNIALSFADTPFLATSRFTLMPVLLARHYVSRTCPSTLVPSATTQT